MRIARSWGVKEFGRGNVESVRQANGDEVEAYKRQKGLLGWPLPLEDYPS